MAKKDYSYIGFGRLFAKEIGGTDNWELGNCSAVDLSATSKEAGLKNFKTGQGNANSSERVDEVSFSITLHDIEKDNLQMMLYGEQTTVVAGSVTDEAIVGKIGGLSRTAQINISTVVVTDSPMTQTYVDGTDYEVTAAGIVVLDGGSIADNDDLLIDYAYSEAQVVEALVNSAKEYELTFVGLNDAQNGKATVVDLFRMKTSIFESLALISEDYAAPTIKGKLSEDSTKTGAGISKFFKYAYAE